MARLLSINVGAPRDGAWRGKPLHRAIWKEPVQGRIAVRQRLLVGQFGENLTVAGLPDDEVCIGNRYRIGARFSSHAATRITVADADALLYVPNPSRRQLERSLRVPALNPGWRASLTRCGFLPVRSTIVPDRDAELFA
jgi:MOSC domain-containing protein YiiM